MPRQLAGKLLALAQQAGADKLEDQAALGRVVRKRVRVRQRVQRRRQRRRRQRRRRQPARQRGRGRARAGARLLQLLLFQRGLLEREAAAAQVPRQQAAVPRLRLLQLLQQLLLLLLCRRRRQLRRGRQAIQPQRQAWLLLILRPQQPTAAAAAASAITAHSRPRSTRSSGGPATAQAGRPLDVGHRLLVGRVAGRGRRRRGGPKQAENDAAACGERGRARRDAARGRRAGRQRRPLGRLMKHTRWPIIGSASWAQQRLQRTAAAAHPS